MVRGTAVGRPRGRRVASASAAGTGTHHHVRAGTSAHASATAATRAGCRRTGVAGRASDVSHVRSRAGPAGDQVWRGSASRRPRRRPRERREASSPGRPRRPRAGRGPEVRRRWRSPEGTIVHGTTLEVALPIRYRVLQVAAVIGVFQEEEPKSGQLLQEKEENTFQNFLCINFVL